MGDEVGLGVGEVEGEPVGPGVGEVEGTPVGAGVGWKEGLGVGEKVGNAVGPGVGEEVGTPVGELVGAPVGELVGTQSSIRKYDVALDKVVAIVQHGTLVKKHELVPRVVKATQPGRSMQACSHSRRLSVPSSEMRSQTPLASCC